MKKTLRLLFLFLSICLYSQPPGLLNPYIACDSETYNGYVTFNLVASDPIGSLGLDPAVYTVTFHLSVVDANNNINIIANPLAYINEIPYSQTIGVRFLNTTTSELNVSGMVLTVVPVAVPLFSNQSPYCAGETIPALPTISLNGISGTWSPQLSNFPGVYTFIFTPNVVQCATFTTMNVIVNPTPTANTASLSFCDPNELPIYNLIDADTQISGGQIGVSVSYYETSANAQVGINSIGLGYVPLINPGTQILFARVMDTVTGCSTVTTLNLNTNNCDQCPAPTNLSATDFTATSLTLNWINPPLSTGSQFFSILVLPYGSPSPTANSIGFINSSTSGPFTITGLNPDVCYSVYVKTNCSNSSSSNWSLPLNTCLPNCVNSGDCSQSLILNAFLDSNNNGVKDNGEINFNNGNFVYQINDSGNNQYGTSNDGSYYIFDANPNNSYDISFAVNPALSSYYTAAVLQNNISLPTGSGDNYLYFPIVNIQPHSDAQVTLYSSGQPRPGFSYNNTIYYQNNGSQTIASGTITFTKAPNVTIAAISQSGTVTITNGFTYDFTNLEPFEVRYITIDLLVPPIPLVNIGNLITNSVTIQTASDINLSNNSSSLTQIIVGSYDPNDKMESHGGKIIHSTFTTNDYLYYTIQFENTGTANAEFIRVEDTLDSHLDKNTFEMIASSHEVNTKRENNQLTWHFYNIDLPPTALNPDASHGFIYFKIKPSSGYSIGDIIPNTASIFFDYNPPIVTNTFNTEFVQELGNPTFNFNTIFLYPNPSNNSITITNNTIEKISKVTIYDITGKTIYQLNKNILNIISVDVSNIAKGIYLVEMTSENNTKISKKLIIQ